MAISVYIRWKVFQRDRWKCVACGNNASDGVVLHVDHIVPVSMGGGNEIGNLQTLCSLCNSGKRNGDDTDLRGISNILNSPTSEPDTSHNEHDNASNWGGAGRGQGRKAAKIRIGRGFTLAVGQQVLCRETFPDGVTPGKIGTIAIEDSNKDGDYTIKINFDDGSAFVIGVYRE